MPIGRNLSSIDMIISQSSVFFHSLNHVQNFLPSVHWVKVLTKTFKTKTSLTLVFVLIHFTRRNLCQNKAENQLQFHLMHRLQTQTGQAQLETHQEVTEEMPHLKEEKNEKDFESNIYTACTWCSDNKLFGVSKPKCWRGRGCSARYGRWTGRNVKS